MSRSVYVLALAGTLVVGRSLLASAQTSRAVGCWRLQFDRWAPSPGGDSLLYQPMPRWIRLTTDTLAGYFLAIRRPNRPPQELRELDSLRAFWKPLSSDSIEVWLPVWWSTGVRARLMFAADTLRGSASIYVDVSPYDAPRAAVVAHRVNCSAAPNER